MKIYFYSSPYDGGESKKIRKALRQANMNFIEINAFGNIQENRHIIHRLSAVPCVIIDFDGFEVKRVEHRTKDLKRFASSVALKKLKNLGDEREILKLEKDKLLSIDLGLKMVEKELNDKIKKIKEKKNAN